jgi:hypothetical protein
MQETENPSRGCNLPKWIWMGQEKSIWLKVKLRRNSQKRKKQYRERVDEIPQVEKSLGYKSIVR